MRKGHDKKQRRDYASNLDHTATPAGVELHNLQLRSSMTCVAKLDIGITN